LGERDLKFCFGHISSVMAAAANDFKERGVAKGRSPLLVNLRESLLGVSLR
jgi:hypothetical protein